MWGTQGAKNRSRRATKPPGAPSGDAPGPSMGRAEPSARAHDPLRHSYKGWFVSQTLSASDEGVTPVEARILRAAAGAAAATRAVIGSHTLRGPVALDQLDILERAGHPAERFIWIHTQAEPDMALHLDAARRGAWIEYDALGAPEVSAAAWVARIGRILDADLGDHLLLSHDRGWYDPALPGGGVPQPYTYLSETLLPALCAAGVDQDTIDLLTRANPFRAFAR